MPLRANALVAPVADVPRPNTPVGRPAQAGGDPISSQAGASAGTGVRRGVIRPRAARSPAVSDDDGDGPPAQAQRQEAPQGQARPRQAPRNGARSRTFTATVFYPPGVSPGAQEEAARSFQDACREAYSRGGGGDAEAVRDAEAVSRECAADHRVPGRDPLGDLCESFYAEFESKLAWLCDVVHKCPDTGRYHAHIAFSFKSPVALSTLLKARPVWHFEVVASAAGIIDYVRKDSADVVRPFREFGVLPAQGKRTDLVNVREVVQNGGNMVDVCSVATSAQSLAAAKVLLTHLEVGRNPNDPPPVVKWFHGSTGSGKTRGAFEFFLDQGFSADQVWVSSNDLTWFDGYDRHKCVLVDDFRKNYCTLAFLLRLLDRYPLRVAIKGGFRQWVPSFIIITCPFEPTELYAASGESVQQLTRRLTEVKLFGDPVPYVPAQATVPHFRSVKL